MHVWKTALFSTSLVMAFLLAAAVTAAVAAVPAKQMKSKVYTVKSGTIINVLGTDLFCTVTTHDSAPADVCFKGLPKGGHLQGYSITASDRNVSVVQGMNDKDTARFIASNGSLASVPGFPESAGKKYALVGLRLGDEVRAAGSHMVLYATKSVYGGLAVAIVFTSNKLGVLDNVYAVGISDHYVEVQRVLSSGKTKVVYRHAD